MDTNTHSALKKFAQFERKPQQLIDMLGINKPEVHAMFPCYLVQYGRHPKYHDLEIAQHLYSDFKPLITAVQNRNYEVISCIFEGVEERQRLIYPAAKGYGVFQEDQLIMDKPTSAMDIIMERDDLQMLKLFKFRTIAAVLKHAQWHNAKNIIQYLIKKVSFTEEELKDLCVNQPSALPSVFDGMCLFRSVFYHIWNFRTPSYHISTLQCKSVIEMFYEVIYTSKSDSKSLENHETDSVVHCGTLDENKHEFEKEVKILHEDSRLFHFYVCLHSLRVKLDILQTSESTDTPEHEGISQQMYEKVVEGLGMELPSSKLVLTLELYKVTLGSYLSFYQETKVLGELFDSDVCTSAHDFEWRMKLLKVLVMYDGINLELEQRDVTFLVRCWQSENTYLLEAVKMYTSMLDHSCYERYRLQLVSRKSDKNSYPRLQEQDLGPRRLIDLCRRKLVEVFPPGQLPMYVTRLALPRPVVDRITLGTAPVLYRFEKTLYFDTQQVKYLLESF